MTVVMKPMNMRAERIRRRMTADDVSRAFGVSKNTLLAWENGSSDPDGSMLKLMAKFYGCTVDWLLAISEKRRPQRRDRA